MRLSPRSIHLFLFFRLPSAFWCGVRVHTVSATQCITSVRHWWFNQNPFHSLYFAVQSMAGELSTGVLVMEATRQSGASFSMLVLSNHCVYNKKATGRILFTCPDGAKVQAAVQEALIREQGVRIVLHSTGRNEMGEIVSEMDFEWTLKVKKVVG